MLCHRLFWVIDLFRDHLERFPIGQARPGCGSGVPEQGAGQHRFGIGLIYGAYLVLRLLWLIIPDLFILCGLGSER